MTRVMGRVERLCHLTCRWGVVGKSVQHGIERGDMSRCGKDDIEASDRRSA